MVYNQYVYLLFTFLLRPPVTEWSLKMEKTCIHELYPYASLKLIQYIKCLQTNEPRVIEEEQNRYFLIKYKLQMTTCLLLIQELLTH